MVERGEYLDEARQHANAVIANSKDEARAVAPAIRIKVEALIGTIRSRGC
jgi:hypothetical protein